MISTDISHLDPWILHLPLRSHKEWFKTAFRCILGAGYQPLETAPNDIQDGIALIWKKGDTYITANRYLEFSHTGDAAGITLEDESESYEAMFSVNTPLEVVFSAIKHLNPDAP